MEPCTREMQHFLTDHDSQIQNSSSFNHHHPPAQEDFLETMMFSSLPAWASGSGVDPAMKPSSSCWDVPPATMSRAIVDESSQSDPAVGFPQHYPAGDEDESSVLASKLQQHKIGGGGRSVMHHHHQQHILMMPLSLGSGGDGEPNDAVDGSPPSSSFKSPNGHQRVGDGTVQALYNGFTTQPPSQTQHLHHPQGTQSFGAGGSAMTQSQGQAQPQASASTSAGAAPAQPKPRVRARRGQATDPHSIAERLRRERIAERMKALQELVPNANKTDKASMLDEIIDYVKFLQLQVKVLSMSRLGGAGAGAGQRVADLSSEGGIDRLKAMGARGGAGAPSRISNGNPTAAGNNDSLTVTEHQVAKLMEEDMGSAMQYLQGKGLCLMPISLATAISTATSQSRHPLFNTAAATTITTGSQKNGPPPPAPPPREGPPSPNMSVLTVQSATAGNGKADGGAVKDTPSASKS